MLFYTLFDINKMSEKYIWKQSLKKTTERLLKLSKENDGKGVKSMEKLLQNFVDTERLIKNMYQIIDKKRNKFKKMLDSFIIPNRLHETNCLFLKLVFVMSYLTVQLMENIQIKQTNSESSEDSSFREETLWMNDINEDEAFDQKDLEQLNSNNEEQNLTNASDKDESIVESSACESSEEASEKDSSSIQEQEQEQTCHVIRKIIRSFSTDIIILLFKATPIKKKLPAYIFEDVVQIVQEKEPQTQYIFGMFLLSINLKEEAHDIFDSLQSKLKKGQYHFEIQKLPLSLKSKIQKQLDGNFKSINEKIKGKKGKQRVKSIQSLAIFFNKNQKYIEAYYCTQQCYEQTRQLLIAQVIALIFLGDFQEAKQVFQKIFDIEERTLRQIAIDSSLYASILRNLGDHSEANLYCEQSLQYFVENYQEITKYLYFIKNERMKVEQLIQNNVEKKDFSKLIENSDQIIKIEPDTENQYTMYYVQSAINKFQELQLLGKDRNHDYFERLEKIEQTLLKYKRINKKYFYFQAQVYLTTISLIKGEEEAIRENLSKTLKSLHDAVKYDPFWLIQMVEFFRKFESPVIQEYSLQLRELYKKLQDKCICLLTERIQKGNLCFQKKEFQTALVSYRSIQDSKFFRQILTSSQIQDFHLKILSCYFKLPSQRNKIKADLYFTHNVRRDELTINQESIKILRKLARNIQDESEITAMFKRIYVSMDEYEYFEEFIMFLKENLDIFQQSNFLKLLNKLVDEKLLKIEKILMRKLQQNRGQMNIRKQFLKFLLFKPKESITKENNELVNHFKKTYSKDDEYIELFRKVLFKLQNITEPILFYQEYLKYYESADIYEKLIHHFLLKSQNQKMILHYQKYIDFETQCLKKEFNIEEKLKITEKIFDLWKTLLKFDEKYSPLEEMKKHKEQFSQFLEEKYESLPNMRKEVFLHELIKNKKQESQQKYVIHLFSKSIALNPKPQTYIEWSHFCKSSVVCSQKRLNSQEILCESCLKQLLVIGSIQQKSQLFLICEAEKKAQFFQGFFEWLSKFVTRKRQISLKNDKKAKAQLTKEFINLDNFLKIASNNKFKQHQLLSECKELYQQVLNFKQKQFSQQSFEKIIRLVQEQGEQNEEEICNMLISVIVFNEMSMKNVDEEKREKFHLEKTKYLVSINQMLAKDR